MLSQIEQFKQSSRDKPESESASDDSGIVYQFKYRPESARLEQTARVAELESRIHRLENILGATDEKLSRLASGNKKGIHSVCSCSLYSYSFKLVHIFVLFFVGSLLETAEHLCATASLLDSAQLDHIEGRLSALLQNLDAVAEKRARAAEDPEKDKMVSFKN